MATPTAVTTVRRRVAVLLIDDDADSRDLLAECLQHKGYSTEVAANGREALSLLETLNPQLIVLDLEMPVMNGLEFREGQRRNPRLLAIPTVVLSGADLELTLDMAIAGSMRKPARIGDLLAFVRDFCTSPTGSTALA